VPPPTTLSKVSSKVQRAKIFDIKDITHLDCLKIPIFSCYRLKNFGLRVPHFGKGLLKPQAEASVLMEAFERFSAEFRTIDAKHTVVNTYNQMRWIRMNSFYL
jgi:YcaO-like protein with predicted kinase domain